MEISITITEAAKIQIIEILKAENLLDAKFRLYIELSHANGYQYSCTIDNEINEDDLVLNYKVQENDFGPQPRRGRLCARSTELL